MLYMNHMFCITHHEWVFRHFFLVLFILFIRVRGRARLARGLLSFLLAFLRFAAILKFISSVHALNSLDVLEEKTWHADM